MSLSLVLAQVVISVAVIPLALLVNNHPPSTNYIDNGAYNSTTSAPTTGSSKVRPWTTLLRSFLFCEGSRTFSQVIGTHLSMLLLPLLT